MPAGSGGPGASGGSGCRTSSTRQPFSGVNGAAAATSKLSLFAGSRASARRRLLFHTVVDPVRAYLEAACALTAADRDDALEERCPHVELDLLRHPHPVVEQVREPVGASRPRLDREEEVLTAALGRELDLAGLEMTVERGEPKRGRGDLHHAHGPVPRAGHADHVLVAGSQRLLVSSHL